MNFKEWLHRNKSSRSTITHYSGAIYVKLGRMSEQVGLRRPLADIQDLKELDLQIAALKAYGPFQTLNNTGHRMYSAALRQFRIYQEEVVTNRILEEDIAAINTAADIRETERLALISARIGQGDYRHDLLALWGDRCAVTGYSDPKFLLASHIKPWCDSNNSERLDPRNGLPLTPNLDRAFDGGLITFDPERNGRIIISPSFRDPEGIGIYSDMRLSALPEPTRNYLEFHMSKIFISEL